MKIIVFYARLWGIFQVLPADERKFICVSTYSAIKYKKSSNKYGFINSTRVLPWQLCQADKCKSKIFPFDQIEDTAFILPYQDGKTRGSNYSDDVCFYLRKEDHYQEEK